jgi:hypothetical protein
VAQWSRVAEQQCQILALLVDGLRAKSPQRREYSRLVETTISQIEAGQFLPHSGIRFPQNGCVNFAQLGLCLGNQQLVEAKLIRTPGASDLIGLTSLTTNGRPLVPPKLNRRRALLVLSKIDEILAWKKNP